LFRSFAKLCPGPRRGFFCPLGFGGAAGAERHRADRYTYVLTKTFSAPGAVQPFRAETIDFRTGESGAFSSGTGCQPTGELERLVFDSLPTVSLTGN
jgi:hypothetical protein